MIAKLTILVCLLAVAHSRYVGLDFRVPLFGSRIVGGHDAKEGEFPHQVSLQVGLPGEADWQHFCGGSIIKSDWILTAVHCLDFVEEAIQEVPLTFVVKVGKRDLSAVEDTEQVAVVKAYFKHKKYIGGGQAGPYDIGLIKLEKPLILNKRVAAIALPAKDSEPFGDVVLSGWGALDGHPEEPKYPMILQTITMLIITRSDCNAAMEKIAAEEGQIVKDLVHDTNICTGPLTGGISSCSGDSGGPLITKNKDGNDELIGIASYAAVPCGRVDGPSVYVRVSSFIDWIEKIIQENKN